MAKQLVILIVAGIITGSVAGIAFLYLQHQAAIPVPPTGEEIYLECTLAPKPAIFISWPPHVSDLAATGLQKREGDGQWNVFTDSSQTSADTAIKDSNVEVGKTYGYRIIRGKDVFMPEKVLTVSSVTCNK